MFQVVLLLAALFYSTSMALGTRHFPPSSVILLRDKCWFAVRDRLLPLARREEEDVEANGDVAFFYDEFGGGALPFESISEHEAAIDISVDCLLTQRQISDRVINPHAEDSEDVFLIPSKLLPRPIN
jgi:hypothetical protein